MAVKKRENKKLAKYEQEEIENYSYKNVNSIQALTYNKKFKNDKQKDLFNTILKNRITLVKGAAGTGKTYISIMAALECIISKNININKITFTKPIIEAAKSIGFLPGDLDEKSLMYFVSFYDNLSKLVSKTNESYLKLNGYVSEIILNFIRGNTFGEYNDLGEPIGHICILDEAQNMTESEMKTFISRMGENTKLVILGDPDQIDIKIPFNELNGLEYAWTCLQDIPTIDFIEFNEDEIVREKLLIEITKRFKQYQQQKGA